MYPIIQIHGDWFLFTHIYQFFTVKIRQMWVNSYIITWILLLVMEKPKDWKCSHAPSSPKICAKPLETYKAGIAPYTSLRIWWREFRDLPDAPFLEDYPRMKDTWLITMVIGFRPLSRDSFPFPNGRFMAYTWGPHPNQLHPLGWSSKFQAPFSHWELPTRSWAKTNSALLLDAPQQYLTSFGHFGHLGHSCPAEIIIIKLNYMTSFGSIKLQESWKTLL